MVERLRGGAREGQLGDALSPSSHLLASISSRTKATQTRCIWIKRAKVYEEQRPRGSKRSFSPFSPLSSLLSVSSTTTTLQAPQSVLQPTPVLASATLSSASPACVRLHGALRPASMAVEESWVEVVVEGGEAESWKRSGGLQ